MAALQEGLVTIDDHKRISANTMFCFFDGSGVSSLVALRENLIKLDELEKLDQDQANALHGLLNNNSLAAFRKGLINIEKIMALQNPRNVRALFEKEDHAGEKYYGLEALVKGYITLAQLDKLSDNLLRVLISENGIKALREGILTVEQAIALNKKSYCVEKLVSDTGRAAVKDGLFTVEQLIALPTKYHIQYCLSPGGLSLLAAKKISIDLIAQVDECKIHVLDAYKPNANISLGDAWEFSSASQLTALLSEIGGTALKENLITVEQAKKVECLSVFLKNDNALQGLRDGLLTVEEMISLKPARSDWRFEYRIRALFKNEYGLQALRAGLIKLNDITELSKTTITYLCSEDGIATARFLVQNALTKQHVQAEETVAKKGKDNDAEDTSQNLTFAADEEFSRLHI